MKNANSSEDSSEDTYDFVSVEESVVDQPHANVRLCCTAFTLYSTLRLSLREAARATKGRGSALSKSSAMLGSNAKHFQVC